MAATITPIKVKSKPSYCMSITDVNLGTYVTGGVSVTISQLGLSSIEDVILRVRSSTAGSITCMNCTYDATNQKVLCYDTTAGETPNSTDLSAITIRIVAFGA